MECLPLPTVKEPWEYQETLVCFGPLLPLSKTENLVITTLAMDERQPNWSVMDKMEQPDKQEQRGLLEQPDKMEPTERMG